MYGGLIRITATADIGDEHEAMLPHLLKKTAKKLLTVPFTPVLPNRKIQLSLTLDKSNVVIPQIEANIAKDLFLNKLPYFELFSSAKPLSKNETEYVTLNNQITISSEGKTIYTASLNSSLNHLTQILLANPVHSNCIIESECIKSFDNVEYNLHRDNCEFVVVAENSPQPNILITTKNSEVKQFVTVFIMKEKYELFLIKGKNILTLLINGVEQDIRRNADDLFENRHIHMTKNENGVNQMKILHFGIDILLDGSKLEVKL